VRREDTKAGTVQKADLHQPGVVRTGVVGADR
jgi:hypothetical protein